MSNVNPNAEQLLASKYQMLINLIQERADIDSRIMIVMTDVSQITGATFANAPVGALEGGPAQDTTPAAKVTKKTTAKEGTKPAEEKQVEQKPDIVVPEQTEVNALVTKIASQGEESQNALREWSKTNKPFKIGRAHV